ncbi:hypothetical protein Sa4125_25730 [Aureimonas sp. SA4125]|nr:hypothetical protein Sa4125_25730 [Aureimonas sp. SA4125]
MLAAVVSLAPLLGGCVSAVDESTAFGFNGTPPAGTEIADASSDAAADAVVSETPETAKSADAEASVAGTEEGTKEVATAAPATPPAEEAAPADASQKLAEGETSPLIASGRTPIAAYAGASVGAASAIDASAPTAAPKASSTLFASLFAQSETKTPVRNADSGKSRRVILKPEGPPTSAPGDSLTTLASLPGVKTRASLFEIGQRASADYDADILDEVNGEEGSYQVASLGGMARLAPNGLMVQRPDVQTNCFEPKLVAVLRAVEARFGTKVVVTSGYRSPSHNRKVRGAKQSMHMSCKAADILVPGADKIQVANFVRSLPGRGGVGTYCHTLAVHIDVGRERDWNWSCTRRRRA